LNCIFYICGVIGDSRNYFISNGPIDINIFAKLSLVWLLSNLT
jgi:hypothetical protein